jgi:hypothetical protein
MSSIILRTTIERQLPKDFQMKIFLLPFTIINDEWIQTLVKGSKREEFFLAEERFLSGY